ncbi:MATE family efflux transporter [Evansella tamaricis]|uniref:MATE family efflux transporter n=1 Tax=Evansella tamaricis TaxID=2069301 RepID=A0ABS6JB64_9BACI|nr:MATE family efflux transporter [Evansella tamaricis]MBU9710924.1 MATE family efflux transporter [Evansella tamaricis]
MSSANKTSIKQLSLFAITWPIFIEVSLQALLQFSDVFMLSFVSDEAVASIGVVNQIMMFTFVLFNFTAMGAGVVVAQYIGAKKQKDASLTIGNAIVLNLLFGLLISAIVVFLRHPILSLFNLSADLYEYANIYMIIVGGTLFTQALVLTIFSVLQAKGLTKDVMYVSLGMNVLNIVGNYVFIFGAFGAPQIGVTGVAIATAVSRLLAMLVLIKMLTSRVDITIKIKEFFTLNKEYISKILKIGIPSAGEHLSYNMSQIVITVFITILGATALATRVYTQNLLMLLVIFSMAMSKGMQIYIGQLVGAGKMDFAYREMYRGLKWALGVAMAVAVIITISGDTLFSFFTSDPDIITLGTTLLLFGLILEPGRTSNLVIISALRASGDAQFPVIMGIVVMWGVSVPFSYILGIHFGYGLIGVWIALILDEWIRAVLMFFRWRSKVWQDKSLVEPAKDHEVQVESG